MLLADFQSFSSLHVDEQFTMLHKLLEIWKETTIPNLEIWVWQPKPSFIYLLHFSQNKNYNILYLN